MMVISKYLNYINDYVNIEKCSKEYNGIIEQFKYNPIPFNNVKERELFKNIETYNFYSGDVKEKETIAKDTRIKKHIYWETVSYLFWKENKKENDEYKNVEYGKEDMKKYLFDNEEGFTNIFGEEDVRDHIFDYRGRTMFNGRIYLKTEKVELEEGITSIGDECFYCCVNLKEIHIPTSVTSFGDYSFSSCDNLSTINIPSSVFSIGKNCFEYCTTLKEITIPSNITSISDYCFKYCLSLSTVEATDVISTGSGCFRNCFQLNTIYVSSNIHSLGSHCFYECSNLCTSNIPKTGIPTVGESCFYGCKKWNEEGEYQS